MIRAEFHRDAIWNDGALARVAQQQQQQQQQQQVNKIQKVNPVVVSH